jgi:eukaryotic-like serine/threonine-protein kinase
MRARKRKPCTPHKLAGSGEALASPGARASRCGSASSRLGTIPAFADSHAKSPMTAPPLAGRYEVLSELGRGAMGTVSLGRDVVLGRQVALKTFRRAVFGTEEEYQRQRQRLLQEARSAASVSHAHVVGIHDILELDDEGATFIVMEFVPGTSLEKLLDQGPLPTHEAVRILGQVAEALDFVHQHGLVHRDIKPANVLIDQGGQVKLSDFGIALPALRGEGLDTSVFGTPQYMAPEQLLGGKMDARTDVFALGVLVFEMLTGEKPFVGRTVSEVASNILVGTIKPAEGGMPFGLEVVLRRSMARSPADRYPSAGEFALAIREALRADPDSTLISGRIQTRLLAQPGRGPAEANSLMTKR